MDEYYREAPRLEHCPEHGSYVDACSPCQGWPRQTPIDLGEMRAALRASVERARKVAELRREGASGGKS
jgi:hypothetical protein